MDTDAIRTLVALFVTSLAASCKGDLSLASLAPSDPGKIILAATQDKRLIQFGSKAPAVLRSNVAITGLVDGTTTIKGLDFRPADDSLFIITAEDRLYTVDPMTGVTTQVGSGSIVGFGVTGFDFDPVSDSIRVIGVANQNKRISAAGAALGTDTTLTYATGDSGQGVTPAVRGVAYSSGSGGVTTAYAIDVGRDVLATLGDVNGSPNSANSGLLFTADALGADHPATSQDAFDIDEASGVGYAAFAAGGSEAAHLWQIDLTTGASSDLGKIRTSADGSDFQIVGLAVSP